MIYLFTPGSRLWTELTGEMMGIEEVGKVRKKCEHWLLELEWPRDILQKTSLLKEPCFPKLNPVLSDAYTSELTSA